MKMKLIKSCLITFCEKKINKFLIILIFAFPIYFLTGLISNSILFMPKEYKTIKKLVDKIASKNNLSEYSIPFTIGAGRYMRYEANSLGLCENEDCFYFSNLNPYKKTKNLNNININSLIRDSYLFNGIDAFAFKGVVSISKSTFRSYGEKENFLGCTIAHEISHIINNNHIDESINLANKLKKFKEGLDEDKISEVKENLEYEFRRKSEMLADSNAAFMMINAGFPRETCLEELTFLSNKEGIEASTDLKDTHPGYIERYKSLEKSINSYEKTNSLNLQSKYKWKWRYDRSLNVLEFIPI